MRRLALNHRHGAAREHPISTNAVIPQRTRNDQNTAAQAECLVIASGEAPTEHGR